MFTLPTNLSEKPTLPDCITPRRGRRGQRGFTVYEALFGIILLGLFTVIFSTAYPLATRLQVGARARAQAVRLARREMEALRQARYDDLASASSLQTYQAIVPAAPLPAYPQVIDTTASGAGPWTFSTINGNDSVASTLPGLGANSPATGQIWVESVDPANPTATVATDAGLRRITVRVTWRDRSNGTAGAGNTRTVNLVSFIARTEKQSN